MNLEGMISVINTVLDFITKHKELIVILLSPVVAVVVGEWLRKRNYQKQQQQDFLRRLISYVYQMSSTYRGEKDKVLEVLNETKYWYSNHRLIKEQIFKVMDKMSSGEDAQDDFIDLIQKISKKAKFNLSKDEITKVFSPRQKV